MSTTAERTRAVIADQAGCNVAEVGDDKHLHGDLSLDSLDRYELTMALEDEFGIRIPDEEADQLKTVGEIVGLVKSKVNGGAA